MASIGENPPFSLPLPSFGTIDVERTTFKDLTCQYTIDATDKQIFSISIRDNTSHWVTVNFKGENPGLTEMMVGIYNIGVAKPPAMNASILTSNLQFADKSGLVGIPTPITCSIDGSNNLIINVKGKVATEIVWTVDYLDVISERV